MKKQVSFRSFDFGLFLAPIAIFCIGILSIYSASFKAQQAFDQALAFKQIMWMGIGALIVFLIIRYDYFVLQDLAWPLYFTSLVLLFVVLFMPVRMGAQRWISIAGFNFQPSEFAKISIILALAHFFKNNRYEEVTGIERWLPFAIVGVPFLLILKQPDLGTGLLIIPVLFAMLYGWGMRAKLLLLILFSGLVASPFLVQLLKEYQRTRLLVFFNPNLDPLGAGYTIIQSKIAIGSGGWLGKGFMAGTQNYLHFVPERHTDFIFAVIGEEGGFLICCLVISLFWLIVAKGYRLATQTTERFGTFLACGITTLIGMQALINIGMTMGVFPVVGVPLPLISYGGSSVISTMSAIGILINIKMRKPTF